MRVGLCLPVNCSMCRQLSAHPAKSWQSVLNTVVNAKWSSLEITSRALNAANKHAKQILCGRDPSNWHHLCVSRAHGVIDLWACEFVLLASPNHTSTRPPRAADAAYTGSRTRPNGAVVLMSGTQPAFGRAGMLEGLPNQPQVNTFNTTLSRFLAILRTAEKKQLDRKPQKIQINGML